MKKLLLVGYFLISGAALGQTPKETVLAEECARQLSITNYSNFYTLYKPSTSESNPVTRLDRMSWENKYGNVNLVTQIIFKKINGFREEYSSQAECGWVAPEYKLVYSKFLD